MAHSRPQGMELSGHRLPPPTPYLFLTTFNTAIASALKTAPVMRAAITTRVASIHCRSTTRVPLGLKKE